MCNLLTTHFTCLSTDGIKTESKNDVININNVILTESFLVNKSRIIKVKESSNRL